MTGLMMPSAPAAAKKVAPMAGPLAPSESRRSGARRSISPKAIAGTNVSHIPATIPRSRSAAAGVARRSVASAGGAGVVQAHAPSAVPKTTAEAKTSSRLVAVANAPITGPSCTPKIAAPSAPPSTSPRRSRGTVLASHASPAAHEHAPPIPWTKRAASSSGALRAKANVRPDTDISVSPSRTVGLHPTRAASQPAGSAPSSVPAAYAPARTPAPAFPSPSSRVSSGSSGVIAA